MFKKLSTAVLAVALVFSVCTSVALAAGSITFTIHEATKSAQATWVQVVAVFTADSSDGSVPVTMIPYDLRGSYLYSFEYYHGTTGVTDNTDLELLEHNSSTGKDILYGAGANVLDNAADAKPTQPALYDGPGVIPVYGNQYIKITGNSVNSATGTLIFRYIR